MASEFRTLRTVEFADTDMAGILHFSNYFRYMEAAEHAFFRSLGLRVHTDGEFGVLGFARGHAECTFHEPLRYEDVVELHVVVREKRRRSIDYVVVFRKEGRTVARGALTVVCVARAPDGRGIVAADLPPEIDGRVEAAAPDVIRSVSGTAGG